MDYRGIVNQWPDAGAMASDAVVRPVVVAQWKHRNTIPARYWGRLLQGARQRRIAVTIDDFLEAAEHRANGA